jgi:hypothetical protein
MSGITSDSRNSALETLHAAFDEVLLAVGKAKLSKPNLELTAFFPVAGESCRGKLMVVGRAVNGWGELPFRAEECLDIKRRAEIFRDAIANVARDSARPLSWVMDKWSSIEPKSYATGRSAFWRVTRSLCSALIPCEKPDEWPSSVAWSNLYKIAPSERGNPSNSLCRVQEAQCISLLRQEINHWQPRYVVFLTGKNWAEPFVGALRPVDLHRSNGPVQSSGRIPMSANGGFASFAVGPHPQGKPERPLVEELIVALTQL